MVHPEKHFLASGGHPDWVGTFSLWVGGSPTQCCPLILLPARAHSEHEAGVGQALHVDGPPLQLVPARSTLAFFFLLSLGGGQVANVDAGLSKGAGETRLALSAPPLGRPKLVPQGHLPCGSFPSRTFFGFPDSVHSFLLYNSFGFSLQLHK